MKVIDKFLPTSDFIAIRDIFINEDLPWYLGHGISGSDSTNAILNPLDNYYFVHLLYYNYMITSQHFELVKDTISKALKNHIGNSFNTITRIKANLYTRTEEVQVHPFHSDTGDIEGLKGALISLNTCDGYTGFADGTEVDSVANRMVLFDAHERHHSCSTSNAQRRLTLNINYV